MAQSQPPAENFFEHLPLQGANRVIDLGQFEIGTGMLLQERQARVGIAHDLGFDPAFVQDGAQLVEPAFPILGPNPPAIKFGEPLGDPAEKQSAKLAVGNRPHHLVPKHAGQVRVVLAEPLLRLDRRLIKMLGPSSTAVLGGALDQTRRDQPT